MEGGTDGWTDGVMDRQMYEGRRMEGGMEAGSLANQSAITLTEICIQDCLSV